MEVFDLILKTGSAIYFTCPVLFNLVIGITLLFGFIRHLLKVDTSSNLSENEKKENRIIIIGAGFSGVGLGCILQMAGMHFVILEKAQNVGGTWWYSNYPGAQVDVKGHSYSFSFFPFKGWTANYPYRDEILSYIQRAAQHFKIIQNIRLNTTFTDARWDEDSKVWIVNTSRGVTYTGRFLVNCMGFLHKPNIPKIEGMNTYNGRMFHSAQWEHDFNYNGKNVAVIGSGATAIQIAPELAKTANVTMFQRTAPTVVDKLGDSTIGFVWRLLWKVFPGLYDLEHYWYAIQNECVYFAFNGSWFARLVNDYIVSDKESQLKDWPQLNEQFKFPEPATLCKRVPIYRNFYRLFAERNCKLETSGIKEFTENGVKTTDGRTLPFDLIVLCTGYDMFHYKENPIVGRGGFNVSNEWDENIPYARLGCQINGYPNYFMLLGPQSGQIHGIGSVFYGECQAELAWRTIRYTLENNYKSFELKKLLMEKHKKAYDAFILSDKAWLNSCQSWYHKKGKVWQPWIWFSHILMISCKYSDVAEQYTFE